MFLYRHENVLQLFRLWGYIFLKRACYVPEDRSLHILNNFENAYNSPLRILWPLGWVAAHTLKNRALVIFPMIKPMQVLIWTRHWNFTFSYFTSFWASVRAVSGWTMPYSFCLLHVPTIRTLWSREGIWLHVFAVVLFRCLSYTSVKLVS
jgi:hypothetical protein